jgi:hypothetical protein
MLTIFQLNYNVLVLVQNGDTYFITLIITTLELCARVGLKWFKFMGVPKWIPRIGTHYVPSLWNIQTLSNDGFFSIKSHYFFNLVEIFPRGLTFFIWR